MADATPNPARWQQAVVLLGAVAVLAWRASVSWDTTVDDAWISARYAEHLAQGYGLVYNAGEPPVEGFTNLAFTVLLGLGRMLGLPMHGLITGVPFGFAVLGMLLTVPLTRTLADRDGWFNLVPAWVVALSPHYAVAATNGLESTMMVAAVLAAVWTGLSFEGRWRWAAAAAAGAVILTRPEGLAVAGALLLYDLGHHRYALRKSLPMVTGVVGTTVALTAFRLVVYGDVVPNTFHAKASFTIDRTFVVNAQYLGQDQGTLVGALAVIMVGGVLPPWSRRRLVTYAIALGLGAIPLTVTLWMPGLRLFLPSMALGTCLLTATLVQRDRAPVHVLAVGLVLALVTAGLTHPGYGVLPLGTLDEPSMLRWGLAGAVALLAAGAALAMKTLTVPPSLGPVALVLAMASFHALRGHAVRHYDWRHSVQPGNGTEQAARHLAANAPDDAWLSTRDAGCFAYWVGTGVKVAELHQRALTQPHPGGANAAIRDYTPTNPEFLVNTQRRDNTTGFVYGNDRAIFQRTTVPYRYLGRIYQHYHRYYDVYARADTAITALPAQVVLNHNGPKTPKTAD